jgi:uncharacterized protein YbjT (DUF2867 family)
VILVAGGTGRLGTLLVRRLADRGLPVRVLTREPARAAHLAGPLVQVVTGDLRDAASLPPALAGVDVVVSAVHGFAGSDVSPESVDREGNIHLIDAAAVVGAAVVLMSIIGAAPDHPIDLFRAKYAAEEYVRRSCVPWTIVRATAFIETWAGIMVTPPRPPNKILVFGRGDNPVNFVSVTDVAALLELAVIESRLRGRVLELGGADATFNQVVAMLQAGGERGPVRHIPRVMLRLMSILSRPINAGFARKARAAVVMDTRDMTFNATSTRAEFPTIPNTDLLSAVRTVTGRESAVTSNQ